ncbi:MAG: hypothetical protein CME61_03215, partial [Halobacteriovoraceae bacterium]|nr:hypothetical protein [Halobacteriovoraceae bacterium]
MEKFKNNFVEYILKNPKGTFCLFILLNIIFCPGLLNVKTDFTYKSWYSTKDPKVLEFQEFEKTFGNDDMALVVVHDEKGILTHENLDLIERMSDELWKVDEVLRVDTLNNFIHMESVGDDLNISPLVEEGYGLDVDLKELKRKIGTEPVLENFLISKDKKTTIIQVKIVPETKGKIPDHARITNDVKKVLAPFKKDNPHLKFHLSGSVIVVDDFTQATIDDMIVLVPLLYIVFILIMFYRYRSITAMVLIFSTISFSISLMMGAYGYLGYKINTLTAVGPTVLMTIALSDAVHVLSAFFQSLKSGFDLTSSLRYSLRKNFYPTLLTSITTSVGFASFFDAKVEPVADLGIMVGMGVLFAWLVTYLGLGPAILFCRRFFKTLSVDAKSSLEVEKNITVSPFAVNLTAKIFKFRKLIVGLTVMSVVFGIFFINKLHVNMDPLEQFKDNHPSVIANRFLEEKLDFSSGFELELDSLKAEGAKDPKFLQKVESFLSWIKNDSRITKSVSLNYILKSVNKALNNNEDAFYVLPKTKGQVAEEILLYQMGLPQGKDINNLISLDNRKLRVTLQSNVTDSKTSNELFNEIKAEAKRRSLSLKLTGKTPLFHDLTPYIVSTFFESFALAFVGITIILIISLRSFGLGLLALIPNLFPLLLGGGLFYFTGFDIDMGTVLVASVCLGIAVDDSIHFLFEY